MNRDCLRISLILCFAAACIFSGATRATLTLAANLALPTGSIPLPSEEEEVSPTGREATESRRQRQVVDPTVALPKLTTPRRAAARKPTGRVALLSGHRWSNGLLAPLLL
jgi:hypothetical protein